MNSDNESDLRVLFDRYGSDKGSKHGYERFYEPHFARLRNQEISLLEIGMFHGASMRCWLDYFPHANVFGIDLRPDFLTPDNQSALQIHPRAKFRFIDSKLGNPFPDQLYDLIIDDGDHNLETQRITFLILKDYLTPNGIYFIEDVRRECKYEQPDGSIVENTRAKYADLVRDIDSNGFSIDIGNSTCKYSDDSTCHILALSRKSD